jgi:hypothetical protein
MLKPQSIRKGVKITLNGKEAEKQEIIELSKNWTEQQESCFKKMLKQGGERNFNGIFFSITPQAPNVNSKGEKDPGKIVYPSSDMRF